MRLDEPDDWLKELEGEDFSEDNGDYDLTGEKAIWDEFWESTKPKMFAQTQDHNNSQRNRAAFVQT